MSTTKNTKKSKKATVAVGGAGAVAEEPELCAICLNTYTPILRKKCVCKYCGGDACSKCIERYLLDGFDDAHCVHCRVNYSDTTLREICTKTYVQNVYFKHRQEVLINREKANLPGLQNAAIRERRKRENNIVIGEIKKEIAALSDKQYDLYTKSSKIYVAINETIKNGGNGRSEIEIKEQVDKLTGDYKACQGEIDDLKVEIRKKRSRIYGIRAGEAEADRSDGIVKEEEKKKFIRRCTRDGCQGFLSTAWKCAICEYYSCSKCFKVKTQKHDDPHECLKEDVETAELIKKDSKPCPNCGEFIMKSSGCSQMFCISCQTPFDWNTGKIVTSGVIHNPHYFEWLKRNGKSMPRNPADIPCGGYPDLWTLMNRITRRINQKVSGPFYEFFRICLEIQEISERSYRTHLDRATMSEVNIKFLLNDCDEKVWGQKLARLERKRKLDAEVQEVFGAFRMVAVELINRVMNYNEDGVFKNFSTLSIPKAEEYLMSLDVEIAELVKMINGGMEEISKTHNYSVPYIERIGNRYNIKTQNFAKLCAKGKRGKQTKDVDSDSDEGSDSEVETEKPVVANGGAGFSRTEYDIPLTPDTPDTDDEVDEVDEDKELQKAIEASIKSATKILTDV
jgi:hypothetical protein